MSVLIEIDLDLVSSAVIRPGNVTALSNSREEAEADLVVNMAGTVLKNRAGPHVNHQQVSAELMEKIAKLPLPGTPKAKIRGRARFYQEMSIQIFENRGYWQIVAKLLEDGCRVSFWGREETGTRTVDLAVLVAPGSADTWQIGTWEMGMDPHQGLRHQLGMVVGRAAGIIRSSADT